MKILWINLKHIQLSIQTMFVMHIQNALPYSVIVQYVIWEHILRLARQAWPAGNEKTVQISCCLSDWFSIMIFCWCEIYLYFLTFVYHFVLLGCMNICQFLQMTIIDTYFICLQSLPVHFFCQWYYFFLNFYRCRHLISSIYGRISICLL